MKAFVVDEQAMLAIGARFAAALPPRSETLLVTLQGDLGAGKTTFCRGLLQALGHCGAVRSPTYTIVESYRMSGRLVHHLDLYRLANAEELENIGGRDLFSDQALCLVEWPERGQGWLPSADIEIRIACQGQGRELSAGALSAAGRAVLDRLQPLSQT